MKILRLNDIDLYRQRHNHLPAKHGIPHILVMRKYRNHKCRDLVRSLEIQIHQAIIRRMQEWLESQSRSEILPQRNLPSSELERDSLIGDSLLLYPYIILHCRVGTLRPQQPPSRLPISDDNSLTQSHIIKNVAIIISIEHIAHHGRISVSIHSSRIAVIHRCNRAGIR